MNNVSVTKLLKAGYVFLRTEDSTNTKNDGGIKYIIKYSDHFGTWKKLGEFPTKAARERELEKLVNNDSKYLF
jgi:hypothetical protein